MKKLLILFGVLSLLNLLDLILTIIVIEGSWFLEENPTMAGAYAISQAAFIAIKIFLIVVGGILLIHGTRVKSRLERVARAALPTLCLVYAIVVISHVVRFALTVMAK